MPMMLDIPLIDLQKPCNGIGSHRRKPHTLNHQLELLKNKQRVCLIEALLLEQDLFCDKHMYPTFHRYLYR